MRCTGRLGKTEKHAAQFVSSLETYTFPKLGKLKVAEVGTADVLAVLMPFWTEKPETARRVRQRIGTVMKWAIAQGWRQDNPAENIEQALPKTSKVQQHRKALGYDEAVWSEIDLERKFWQIPADRMKMKRPHRVPLSAPAVAILRQAEGLADDEGYVFPGAKRGRPLSAMPAPLKRILRARSNAPRRKARR